MSQSDTIKPSDGFNYYHQLVTWGSFPEQAQKLNRLVSGDPANNWMAHLKARHPTFRHCLSINCGNGWVEREMFRKGIFERVTGTDIMAEHLKAAQAEADAIGMPAKYIRVDVNNDPVPDLGFDLAFNHAALHHVANIDFVVRRLCQLLPENGILASYDYTGPHRNQYDYEMWSRAVEFNHQQPEHLRNDRLIYPHMRTMLHIDPSEAIHSELIIPTFRRYFHIEEQVALGGAFAYLLLQEHSKLHKQRDTEDGRRLLAEIMRIDDEVTAGDIDRSLFTFLVLRPNKAALENTAQLDVWTCEEAAREEAARQNGGRYSPASALELVYDDLAMANWKLEHAAK